VPKDLVIALDRSGSMSGEKITQAKSLADIRAQDLNPGDRFNIIVYNDVIDPLFEGLVKQHQRKHIPSAGNDRPDQRLGGTNMHDALAGSLRAAGSARADKRSRYILFLTDGLPTVGKTDEKVILRDTKAANGAGARVFAMG